MRDLHVEDKMRWKNGTGWEIKDKFECMEWDSSFV